MTEPRTRPSDAAPETDPVRRRVRQKTSPAFATFEALGGSIDEEDGFSYGEALQKSSPHFIGFSQSDIQTDVGGDNDWISTHWKSSSQRRRADMGDPTAVDADMVGLIAPPAERPQVSSEGNSPRSGTPEADPAVTSHADNLSVEITINFEVIDVDGLENNQKWSSLT